VREYGRYDKALNCTEREEYSVHFLKLIRKVNPLSLRKLIPFAIIMPVAFSTR
jgi:hypothetical protein